MSYFDTLTANRLCGSYMEASVFRLAQNTSRHRDMCMDSSSRGACIRSGSWRCSYLRNAGGRNRWYDLCPWSSPQQQMGTREIVVLHHTDRGACDLRNEGSRQHLKKELGSRCVGDIRFSPFSKYWREAFATSPSIPGDVVISELCMMWIPDWSQK